MKLLNRCALLLSLCGVFALLPLHGAFDTVEAIRTFRELHKTRLLCASCRTVQAHIRLEDGKSFWSKTPTDANQKVFATEENEISEEFVSSGQYARWDADSTKYTENAAGGTPVSLAHIPCCTRHIELLYFPGDAEPEDPLYSEHALRGPLVLESVTYDARLPGLPRAFWGIKDVSNLRIGVEDDDNNWEGHRKKPDDLMVQSFSISERKPAFQETLRTLQAGFEGGELCRFLAGNSFNNLEKLTLIPCAPSASSQSAVPLKLPSFPAVAPKLVALAINPCVPLAPLDDGWLSDTNINRLKMPLPLQEKITFTDTRLNKLDLALREAHITNNCLPQIILKGNESLRFVSLYLPEGMEDTYGDLLQDIDNAFSTLSEEVSNLLEVEIKDAEKSLKVDISFAGEEEFLPDCIIDFTQGIRLSATDS